MNQDNYLASVAAQLGVKVADRSTYDGMLVGQITISALVANAAKAAGDQEPCVEQGTAAMLRVDNAQPWRGIITGVEAVISGDGAAAPAGDTYADADIFLRNTEVVIAGSGGTLRIPSLQCGSIRPSVNTTAALYGSTNSRDSYTALALPYFFDSITLKGFRWLFASTTVAAMTADIILTGIFASATQSKGDSNESVPGVSANAAHICPVNPGFLAAISRQLLSQNRVPLTIESTLTQGYQP